MAENQSTHKTAMILEVLYQDDFSGKSLDDVIEATDITWTTAWRILKTLKADGWVIETTISGQKKTIWKISQKILEIAHAYKRHSLKKVHAIESEYLHIAGEELRP